METVTTLEALRHEIRVNVVNGYIIIYNKGSVVYCVPGPRRGRKRGIFTVRTK